MPCGTRIRRQTEADFEPPSQTDEYHAAFEQRLHPTVGELLVGNASEFDHEQQLARVVETDLAISAQAEPGNHTLHEAMSRVPLAVPTTTHHLGFDHLVHAQPEHHLDRHHDRLTEDRHDQ